MRVAFILLFLFFYSATQACRYTIREIGFSSLAKTGYVLYRVNENGTFFPEDLQSIMTRSNIKTYALARTDNRAEALVQFAVENNMDLPAYILADPEKNYWGLAAWNSSSSMEYVLHSPIRNRFIDRLPDTYAAVLLIEGKNEQENKIARSILTQNCIDVENIMPHMPKQVKNGPYLGVLSNDIFEEEKVLLWSLGLNEMPKHPLAFVFYGKGRVMGEQVNFADIKNNVVYKLLSIIGADCECGLDKKWMLGRQIPLNWPESTSQKLNDILGFDVENPMVLAEMSRILLTENKQAIDPDGISFAPEVIDLDEAFDDIPEVDHRAKKVELVEAPSKKNTILNYLLLFGLFILIGAIFILKLLKKN